MNVAEPSPTPRADLVRSLPVRPTEQVPPGLTGSKGAPFFGHTLSFLKDARELVWSEAREHGLDFRLRMFGLPLVVVGHPDQVKTVLMDRDKNFSSKLGWHNAIGELFARGLMLRDFEEHRTHRKIMQIAFRADAMRGYLDMMNPIIEGGLDQWAARPEFRFYDAIKQLTLDIAADVFVGVQLGAEADRINQAFVDSVQASIALVKKEVPFLSYKRGMDGRRLLEQFFAERIDDRRRGNGRDMFSEFCRATTDEGESFSDQDIVDHMIFLLMAAHDTTTSSLTSVIWALAQNQEWQEHLRDEALSIGGDHLTWEDRDRVVLGELAFKEALRMFPPVPFISRRSMDTCQLGEHELPANSGVAVCSLVTHFAEEFWTDPMTFDPERFTKERAEDRAHSHVYYPFGGGAHTCLGMHFAYSQVKAFLHQFLRRFRVHLPEGYELDMQPVPIPKPKDGLPVRLEPLE